MNGLMHQLMLVGVFSAVGIVIFAIVWKVIVALTPFSIRKEIEEDQNISLAILIGCVFLSIALIISAAIHG
jgi:uncharacterized membrane protein YjfL (UPF0719 family)